MASRNDIQGGGGTSLTKAEALRLTTRIQLRLETIADNAEAVLPMITKAKEGEAHQALGYPSWTAYVSDKFTGTLARLAKTERQPFVEMMAEHGMSTRAIPTAYAGELCVACRKESGYR